MIDRDFYLEKILDPRHPVKLLTGCRRSGKTTLLKMTMQRSSGPIEWIDFDDPSEDRFKNCYELYDHLSSKVQSSDQICDIYLDEIDRMDSWENVAVSLAIDFNCRIFASTSSGLGIGKRDGIDEIFIAPLSASELFQQSRAHDDLRGYLTTGGMPDCIGLELKHVLNAFDSIIMREIVARFNIRDIPLLLDILSYIAKNTGKIVSAKNAADTLRGSRTRLSTESVYSYIEVLEKAGIVIRCPRYDLKTQKYLGTMEKLYVIDTGLRNALLSDSERDIKVDIENAVFIELLRRGFKVSAGRQGKKDPGLIAVMDGCSCCVNIIREMSQRRSDPFRHIPKDIERYAVIDDISGDLDGLDTSRFSANIINASDLLMGRALKNEL